MNKKYYYSNPLDAAYMAQHFEMVLCLDYGDDGMVPVDLNELLGGARDKYVFGEEVARYYIHPDSYCILKPRICDTVRTNDWRVFYVKDISGLNRDMVQLASGPKHKAQTWNDHAVTQILARNMVPFIWPFCEAA